MQRLQTSDAFANQAAVCGGSTGIKLPMNLANKGHVQAERALSSSDAYDHFSIIYATTGLSALQVKASDSYKNPMINYGGNHD